MSRIALAVVALAALLAAIGISVTITTATGCYQKATGPEQDKAASDEMPVTASNISRDEEVVFFPTCAHFDEAGKTWTVPIHGIIYEPEADSRKRHAMVRALARTLHVEAGTEEAENLDRRLRLFLVDNERGKSLYVRIDGKVYDVGTSGPNGHFQGTLRFSAVEMEHLVGSQVTGSSFLSFEAVTCTLDDRSFTGRVQLVGPTGLSIISDIDDTIKHSQIGDRKAVLVNTFLRRFKPVPDMPELYRDCAHKGMVFHYVSGGSTP